MSRLKRIPLRLPRRALLLKCAITLLPVTAYVLQVARFGRWLVDDAAITFAYARSLADGHGFVAQPGAPTVEGYSNPLWLVPLVLGKLLHLFDSGTTVAGVPDYVWYPKLLGLLCFIGTVLAVQRAAQAALGARVAELTSAFFGLLLAFIPSYVLWSCSGLENGLYGLLVAALTAELARAAAREELFERKVAVRAALLTVGCALTRPDGLAFAGAYPLAFVVLAPWLEQRSRAWRGALAFCAAFAGALGSFLLVRYAVFGAWLPNTAVAKAQALPTWATFQRVSELLEYVGQPLCIAAAGLFGAALLPGRADPRALAARRSLLSITFMLLLSVAAFAILNRDWMMELRFATPVWVGSSFLLSFSMASLVSDTAIGRWQRAVWAAVASLALANALPTMRERMAQRAARGEVSMCQVADTFRLFNMYADLLGTGSGALVLADVGGSSLTSRHLLVDCAGLTDRTVALALRNNIDWPTVHRYVLDRVKPTFLHRHGVWLPNIGAEPDFERDYVAFQDGTDYVARKWVAEKPALLLQLRLLATTSIASVLAYYTRFPRSSCGERLTPGSLPEEHVLKLSEPGAEQKALASEELF